MGLQALYSKRRTSRPGEGHKIYPYLLRRLESNRPNQVWLRTFATSMAKDYVNNFFELFSEATMNRFTLAAVILRRVPPLRGRTLSFVMSEKHVRALSDHLTAGLRNVIFAAQE